MNALCDLYREQLALYAEGEIAESALRDAIRIHLVQCQDCRDWIDDYEELTKDIVELVSPRPERLPGYSDRRWAPPGYFDVADGPEADRTERILQACLKSDERPAMVAARVECVATRSRWSGLVHRFGRPAAAAALLIVAVITSREFFGPSAPAVPFDPAPSGALQPRDGVARASAPESRDAVGADHEIELLRWFFDDEEDARSALTPGSPLTHTVSSSPLRGGESSDEIELLGLLRSYAPDEGGRWIGTNRTGSAPRWRLRARREFFRDPDGGGWVFLVPEAPRTGPSSVDRLAIPLRRIDLRPAAVNLERRGVARRRGRRVAGCYRLVIVPDVSTISERLSRAAWSVRSREELRGPSFRDPVDRLFVDHDLPAASISRVPERF